MPATPGNRISLIYVFFLDFIKNSAKYGAANVVSNRAYHLSLDWGMIDYKNSFYFQCTSCKHSNEVGLLEEQVSALLDNKDLKVKPRYPDGREAHGSGETEFFRYEGIFLVLELFYKWQSEGRGKIIHGFEPSDNLPPLRSEPGTLMEERKRRELGLKPY